MHERGDTGDHSGQVNRALLSLYFPKGQPRCYFVGPQGFMNAVNHALEELDVPKERRHFEHFGPSRSLEVA